MLELVFRPRAEADIRSIATYTKSEYGEAQAKKYIEDIRRQIEFVAEFPGIGSAVVGLPDLYRKVRSGSHRVIYRQTEHELVIVRIVHEREDVLEDGDELL